MCDFEDEEVQVVIHKQLLSLKDASKVYSIPLNTLYKLSSQKKIPKYKIGRRVYVKPRDLEEWLQGFYVNSVYDDF